MIPGRVSFVERMVGVRDVAWGRKPGVGYWVMWEQDGLSQTADFITAHSAQAFAQWLDTAGTQPSVREVREAEQAFRDLEEATKEPISLSRWEELRELGVPMATPRQVRRATHRMRKLEPFVHVRWHRRRA